MLATSVLSSGLPTLDALLPEHGWPAIGLTDVHTPRFGADELVLLAPMLRALTRAGRTIVLLAPPQLSWAPALLLHGIALDRTRVLRASDPLDGLYAIEDELRAGRFAALVAWQSPFDPVAPDARRRLQMAARLCRCPAFLFHHDDASGPGAALRIGAHFAGEGQLDIHIPGESGQPAHHARLDVERPHPPARPAPAIDAADNPPAPATPLRRPAGTGGFLSRLLAPLASGLGRAHPAPTASTPRRPRLPALESAH